MKIYSKPTISKAGTLSAVTAGTAFSGKKATPPAPPPS